jgi:hypothetical protein
VPTEWLKVMLDEIARKRDEAARAREELERRRAAVDPASPQAGSSASAGSTRASA